MAMLKRKSAPKKAKAAKSAARGGAKVDADDGFKSIKPKLRTVFSYPSWCMANDQVEVSLAKRGGHLGPITYFRKDKKFSPMAVAPWHKETKAKYGDRLLSLLRGDFFCMPFGANVKPVGKEKHACHGETANNDWSIKGIIRDDGFGCDIMVAEIRTKIRKAKVEKQVCLRDGDEAVYIRHNISDMSGPMDYGHHAMLKWEKQGAGLISTSKTVYGQVYPGNFEDPAMGGYNSLKAGATFDSLAKVPLANGGYADLTVYPARLGFEDLVIVCSDPKAAPFAWTAAVYPEERVVWFALKDPKKLASTVLWHSNRGRHYAPWSGRHIGVLGIEEVTAYFSIGLAESIAANPVSRKGIATSRTFKADETFSIPYIMAAAKVPAGFDHVKTIEPAGKNKVRLVSKSGKKADAGIAWEFIGE